MKIIVGIFLILVSNAISAREITIGIVSNFSELSPVTFSPYGGHFRDALKLSLAEKKEELDKKNIQINLQEFDYGSNDINVISEAKKAIESKALAVIGYNYSSNALIAAPLHVKYKLPMLTPSASANRLNEFQRYVHMGSFDNNFMAKSLAIIALKTLQSKKVLIITAADCAYCMDMAKSFEIEFKKNGGLISKTISVLQEEKDFSPIIKEIRALEFDAVLVPNQELTSARIISTLIEAGYSQPFLGADGWGNEGNEFFNVLKNKNFVGYSVTHWHPKLNNKASKNFISNYTRLYKRLPNDTSVLAYDAMNLLIEAILRSKNLNREGVEDSLNSITKFNGVTGNFQYGNSVSPQKDVLILKSSKSGFKIYGFLDSRLEKIENL